MEKRKIYAFDFDGTLTCRDSLLEFIRYVAGGWRLLFWIASHAHLLAMMKAGMYSNHRLKEMLCARMFGGMAEEELRAAAESFAARRAGIIRPGAMDAVERALDDGATVCVVSASASLWVKPFFGALRDWIVFLTTEMEVCEGKITGRFSGSNCYGQEKVNRIRERFPDRENYVLIAYGDSRGDREMLAYADEAHFKPFRGGEKE